MKITVEAPLDEDDWERNSGVREQESQPEKMGKLEVQLTISFVPMTL